MINYIELLEKELNYGTREPDNVDSKLLFMGLKDHLRDPVNFQNMMNRSNRYRGVYHGVYARELNIPDELKEKHGNLRVEFHHDPTDPAGASYSQEGSARTPPNKRIHLLQFHKFTSLHSDNLSTKPLPEVHEHFMRQLSSEFSYFHHEFTHYSDLKNRKLEDGYKEPANQKEYINSPEEVKAWTAEKSHDIERALLQNNSSFLDASSYHDLPLRKRLYHFRNNEFVHQLQVIHNHSMVPTHTSGHDWYNSLTQENQQKVKSAIKPIIDKYMVSNPGY